MTTKKPAKITRRAPGKDRRGRGSVSSWMEVGPGWFQQPAGGRTAKRRVSRRK